MLRGVDSSFFVFVFLQTVCVRTYVLCHFWVGAREQLVFAPVASRECSLSLSSTGSRTVALRQLAKSWTVSPCE